MPARTALSAALRDHRVFGHLPEAARSALAGQFGRQVFDAGAEVASGPALLDHLGWVLAGELALRVAADADPVVVLRAGDLFGAGAGPFEQTGDWQAIAQARCELAFLPASEVARLCAEHPAMAFFLDAPAAEAAAAPGGADPHLGLMATPVHQLVKRTPVTLPPNATVLQTAQTMREQRVSSVMLMEQGHLFGLVTDRDLRNRALAAGLDPQAPVHEIATVAPLTLDIHAPAFEALLLMARHNIHHLPLLDGQRVAGMLTATDLTEQQSTSAVYLASEIHKQATIEGLVAAASRVKLLQRNLAAADASAYSSGHIVTAITDAITSRLLVLAELSNFERSQLKDAFGVVQTLQNVLAQRYR